MTIKSPLWLENLDYSATDERRLLLALFPGVGVIDAGDLAVTQNGAGDLSVNVAAGSAMVAGTDVAEQGYYLFSSDAVVNVEIATPPGAGNSRTDLIVAQIQDQDADGGVNNDGIIVAVTGEAAPTGTQDAPAAPNSSLVLATVVVGPDAVAILTANITDVRSAAFETPAGSLSANGAEGIDNGVLTDLVNMTAAYLRGGMTASEAGASFLTRRFTASIR